MDVLAKSIAGMSHSVESLAGGVSYNTSRVGALSGEFQKIRKHLEWSQKIRKHLEWSIEHSPTCRRRLLQRAVKILEEWHLLWKDCTRVWISSKRIFERWHARWKQCVRFQLRNPSLGHLCHLLGTLGRPTRPTHPSWVVWPVGAFSHPPARAGETPMSHPAKLEIPFMKNPPVRVLDENTGGVRNVSPTRQLHPNTGTAAFSPLGYMVLKGSTDYRRIYP